MKVYADTSTLSGCFDEEFAEWSNALVEEVRVGKKRLVLSDLTLQELELSPQEGRTNLMKFP